MRAVVQRVTRASVSVEGEVVGAIEAGLCILVGVMNGDASTDAIGLARKVARLRIFVDEADKMNLSVKDVGGAALCVSQFTLAGDARKGNRPSFVSAMDPGPAHALFEEFCRALEGEGVHVAKGRFRAHMQVALVNDGPVTILLDTQQVA